MLPADWQEYVAKLERQIASRPSDAPKPARPIRSMTSGPQGRALSQTRNWVRASYQDGEGSSGAQVRPASRAIPYTTSLGGNCEKDIPHGKATRERRPS